MRVLVAYASRTDSTTGIAEEIGRALRERGTDADVHEVETIDSVAQYDGVIVGSAVRVRRWLPEAMDFLEAFRQDLASKPVAYFAVSLTGVHGTRRAITEAEHYADYPEARVPEVRPLVKTSFNGALDYSKLMVPEQVFVRTFGVQEGDYRDWDAIRRWAAEAAQALGVEQPTHV